MTNNERRGKIEKIISLLRPICKTLEELAEFDIVVEQILSLPLRELDERELGALIRNTVWKGIERNLLTEKIIVEEIERIVEFYNEGRLFKDE